MKSAQFFKGMINGTEAQYESPDLIQLLPGEKLNALWDQERIGTHNRIFLDERAVAKTVITQ
jgi:hypothetical protein